MLLIMLFFVGCAGSAGPTGPAGPAGATGPAGKDASIACQSCHDNSTTIVAKQLEYEHSVHLVGGNWEAHNASSCAACHEGQGFVDAQTASKFNGSAAPVIGATTGNAYPAAAPTNCRTCHLVHTTYTSADFALRTTAPVKLFAVQGATYDKGKSNLCANCHQSRSVAPKLGDPPVTTTTHYEPMGPQAEVFLGIGGYNVPTTPSVHYVAGPADGCVTCHMASGFGAQSGGHSLNMTNAAGAPNLTACVVCHTGLTTFDRNGVQAAVKAQMATLQKALIAKGLLTADGTTEIAGTFPSAQAGALFNWEIAKTDNSFGVHNPAYIKALLTAGIAALQ
jgi:hypothetical protein